MTSTSTRTTRKGFTARLITALLAVLAVMAGALVMAGGAAVANDDVGTDNWGHHDKMTICHVVHGKGETKGGYDIIPIDEHAWPAHQEHGDSIWTPAGCPTRPTDHEFPMTWKETICYNGQTIDVDVSVVGKGYNEDEARDDAQRLIGIEKAKYPGYQHNACPRPPYTCKTYTAGPAEGSGTYCTPTGTQTLTWSATAVTREYREYLVPLSDVDTAHRTEQPRCPDVTYDEAKAEADAALATALADAQTAATQGLVAGACVVSQSWTGDSTMGGAVDFCLTNGTTVSVAYSGTGHAVSSVSQAVANSEADAIARQNADADLLAKTPAGATTGACGVTATEPTPVAPVEAATVAVPEAATVAEPATVAVPEAATAMPATVPAGDGSSAPTVPNYLLALLALAGTVLAATTVHLVRTTR